MSDRHALIEAVRENPDDDTPRLICADWYDEFAESLSGTDRELVAARAEFIRVQCALARTRPDDPQYADHYLRQLDLLARYESQWLGVWSERLVRWEFRRGFLHTAVFTPDSFMRDGAQLFRHEPIWNVTFRVSWEDSSLGNEGPAEPGDRARPSGEGIFALASRLVDVPHFELVRSLNATGGRFDEPYYGRYYGPYLGDAFCHALADAPRAARLEELDLGSGHHLGVWFHERALFALVTAPHLRALRRLNICCASGRPRLDDSALRQLTRSPIARNLEHLDTTGVVVPEPLWRNCMARGCFPRLAERTTTWAGRVPFQHEPDQSWPGKVTPRVRLHGRSDGAVAAAATDPRYQGVTWLSLSCPTLSAETAVALTTSPAFQHLETLYLSSGHEGGCDAAYLHFARPGAWPRLRNLVIGNAIAQNVLGQLAQRLGVGSRLRLFHER